MTTSGASGCGLPGASSRRCSPMRPRIASRPSSGGAPGRGRATRTRRAQSGGAHQAGVGRGAQDDGPLRVGPPAEDRSRSLRGAGPEPRLRADAVERPVSRRGGPRQDDARAEHGHRRARGGHDVCFTNVGTLSQTFCAKSPSGGGAAHQALHERGPPGLR